MKIEHIALYAKDIEVLKDFYIKYFGATSNNLYHNTVKNFKSYFLSFEDGARLEIMNIPELADNDKNPIRQGFIHLAISVGSNEKVQSLTEQLRNDGYKITSEPRTTGDGYFESCILDPEGNLIEITA